MSANKKNKFNITVGKVGGNILFNNVFIQNSKKKVINEFSIDLDPHERKAEVVFNAGFGDIHSLLSNFFSTKFDVDFEYPTYNIYRLAKHEYPEVIYADEEKKMMVHILYFVLEYNSKKYTVGFYFPDSDISKFDFDLIRIKLHELFPKAYYTTDSGFANVVCDWNLKERNEYDVIALIDIGSEYALKLKLYELVNGFRQDGKYTKYKYESMYKGKYYDCGNNTYICVNYYNLCGHGYVVYYLSGSSGDTSGVYDRVHELFPETRHCDIEDFEDVIKPWLKNAIPKNPKKK